jgi:hypothetical protein
MTAEIYNDLDEARRAAGCDLARQDLSDFHYL